MTAEEAAEEILKGALRPCEKCHARGFIGEAIRVHDEVTATLCDACLGAGCLLRQEFVCASLFLGIPVPDYPENVKAAQERVIHKIADAAMIRILPKMKQNGIKVDQTIIDELRSWQDEPTPRVPLHFTPPSIARISSSQPNLLTWDQKKPQKKY